VNQLKQLPLYPSGIRNTTQSEASLRIMSSSSQLSESRARADAAQQHFKSMRNRLNQLNAEAVRVRESFKRPQKTVEQIRQEVKALEFKRNTTSMSLQEEKRIIKQMEKLNSDRKVSN
jgi:uncharacterized coiled-coil DUF342 family protein